MLLDEKRSTIKGVIGFIEDTGERLENMRDVGRNIEDHIHACFSCTISHLSGVVKEYLVSSDLEQKRWKSGEICEPGGAQEFMIRVLSSEVHRIRVVETLTGEIRVDPGFAIHTRSRVRLIQTWRERHH
nr:hypothetical protein [Paenibacillus sp. UNC496MF]